MKFSELADFVNGPGSLGFCHGGSPEVVIRIDKHSIGPSATVPVRCVAHGFDWDNGKVIIHPETPLVPKSNKEKLFDEAYNFIFQCALGRNIHVAKEAKRLLIKAYGHDPAELEKMIQGMLSR
jgi:hypothetical protein